VAAVGGVLGEGTHAELGNVKKLQALL